MLYMGGNKNIVNSNSNGILIWLESVTIDIDLKYVYVAREPW